jgi:hypothetical protein
VARSVRWDETPGGAFGGQRRRCPLSRGGDVSASAAATIVNVKRDIGSSSFVRAGVAGECRGASFRQVARQRKSPRVKIFAGEIAAASALARLGTAVGHMISVSNPRCGNPLTLGHTFAIPSLPLGGRRFACLIRVTATRGSVYRSSIASREHAHVSVRKCARASAVDQVSVERARRGECKSVRVRGTESRRSERRARRIRRFAAVHRFVTAIVKEVIRRQLLIDPHANASYPARLLDGSRRVGAC